MGGWSLSQLSVGKRRGTLWTSRQFFTGPHRDKQPLHTHILTCANLESPYNLTCVDSGSMLEYLEKTHTGMREHANMV